MSSRREVPGTGLSLIAYLFLLAIAVGLFLVWGGLLWKAPRQASHVMRFVVSYLAVIPLAALALWIERRFSWGHLFASVGTLWAIKMVITATLYQFAARGVDASYEPVEAHAPPAPSAPALGSQAAPARFVSGRVEGTVRAMESPVTGAVVWIDAPPPGLPATPRERSLAIHRASYPDPIALVQGTLRVRNSDEVLHTAHLFREGRAIGNRSLPAGAEASFHLAEPGLYRIRCDNHPDESIWIVAVDHPYASITGADGRFGFDEAPAGPLSLHAAAVISGSLATSSARVELAAGAVTAVDLSLGIQHAFNAREAR